MMSQENRLLLQMPRHQVTVTSEPQIYHCPIAHCPEMVHLPEDGILLAWLDAKTSKSQSWKTHVAYHTTAISLRTRLRAHGYDLLMDLSDDTALAGYLLIV